MYVCVCVCVCVYSKGLDVCSMTRRDKIMPWAITSNIFGVLCFVLGFYRSSV